MTDPVCVVFTTLPDGTEARRMATVLVEERLAACGSVVPGVESVYRWEGRVTVGEEVLLLLKTTRERSGELEARLRELHPYEVPEILRLGVEGGWPPYLGWVAESVRGEPRL